MRQLVINHLPVEECRCTGPNKPHWSVLGLRYALGRELTMADSIHVRELEAEPIETWDALKFAVYAVWWTNNEKHETQLLGPLDVHQLTTVLRYGSIADEIEIPMNVSAIDSMKLIIRKVVT